MSATSRSMNTVNAGAPGPLTGSATSRNIYSSPRTPVSSLENNNIVALHAKIAFDKDTYVQLFDNINQHIGVVEQQVGNVECQVGDLDQRLIDLEAMTETNHQDLTNRLGRSNKALLHWMDTDKQQLFELLSMLASRLDTIVAHLRRRRVRGAKDHHNIVGLKPPSVCGWKSKRNACLASGSSVHTFEDGNFSSGMMFSDQTCATLACFFQINFNLEAV
ncbi:hypothetical protein K439DRAFT_1509140 [Ramaria rubella]|nr:hypothetical protein K439DRAFT_1509140 [Ramaria rubella]